ncbi:cation-translocating P-type ATPase [Pseudanabaena sp. PCC 6802]|uniref:cation-translocating P-type ATPase n=1 Tax=Pseudanabaena sp. PCC 6802 TaxID=118173 RepID=UPI000366B7E4|nr:cation-translocating P-type ATPase [Pseudanabaena sp. PCC 6802]
MSKWYQLETSVVLEHFKTDATRGLSHTEVEQRLAQFGFNEIEERALKNPWLILWEQLTALIVVVLIVAAGISALVGDYKDTIAILAIVLFNALLGFNQEYQAGQALAALKKMAIPKVKVYRDRQLVEISARQLVPGDIVLLEAGNLVPADCRLLESINLRVQESTFTGEAEPVEKTSVALAGEELALGDRRNMVYMGTAIVYGRGKAVVTETGMRTELGKIADSIQSIDGELTPLQQRLDRLGQKLVIASLILVGLIFGIGLLRGESLKLMFMTAVSMAVAVIPEGLPAVVTITLALGANRMLKRNALIRNLPAVETLGSTIVICSDKTGTLTENQMTVNVLAIEGQKIDLNGGTPNSAFNLLLTGAALCNDVRSNLSFTGDRSPLVSNRPSAENYLGDPTEVALAIAAKRLGLDKIALDRKFRRIFEIPFDSERQRMTTVHQCSLADVQSILPDIHDDPESSTRYIVFSKGAVGSLLEITNLVWVKGGIEKLDDRDRDRIISSNDELAQTGMRVLGIAFRYLDRPLDHSNDITLLEQELINLLERDLVFIGMVGILDPPRPEVREAVQTCKKAGIRPIMITGDHPLAAQYIAKELDIDTSGKVLVGSDLARLSPAELSEQVELVSVYARVSPQQKLRIVQALQSRGHIVAMTGDGINDAPALRKADIGVAMGLVGTDVCKEAADMVLLDDNFATIVAAVAEGRVIYDNIRKFIKYSMTGNASGVWIVLLAPFLSMPLPLLPLQILWINLLADGLLALSLSVEPAESDTMQRSPYPKQSNIFNYRTVRDIVWVGLMMGVSILLLGYEYRLAGELVNGHNWQTMVFVTLTFSRMSLALAMRSEHDSLFKIGLLSNPPLSIAVVLTFLLQIAVIYLPWLQASFQTVALSAYDLTLCLAVSTVGFWLIEIEKWLYRRSRSHAKSASAKLES